MGNSTKERNNGYIIALNNAYRNHKLVIFYGAGLSRPLGLPDWKGLIESILGQFIGEEYEDVNSSKEEIEQEMEEMDFWVGMDYLKKRLDISNQDLKETIVRIISEREQLNCPSDQQWEDNNYEDLAKMKVNLFMTTNYDKVFPKCLGGHCETIDFMKAGKSLSDKLDNSGDDKKIIYLHGIVDDPSSIVISENDVNKIYSNKTWLGAFSTVLNSYKVLFIGVSFSDPFLQKFLKKTTSLNQNSFYAMVLDEIDEKQFPGKQIVVDKDNPVSSIRNMLARISRQVENIVILRVSRIDDENKKNIKICLMNELDIFHEITFTLVDDYTLISFQTFQNNLSLKAICEQIEEVIEGLSKSKALKNKQFVCFISQNTRPVGMATGMLQETYKKEQFYFLNKLISKDSYGFIIDKISLNLKDGDKEWIQHFVEKKGMIYKENKEYSVYSQDNIKIQDSHNSGSEVHVAGFIYLDGRIVLEKRKASEASVPDKFSLPGGRLKKEEGFRDALKRILKEKYGIIAEYIVIIDEFKVYDANIPGLAFGVYIHEFPKSFSYELFDQKKIGELLDDQLACSRELIDRAFNILGKKEKIKLRIIMLTDCVYNCRCCHHENIKEIFNECQIEKVENNLDIIGKKFDIQQITITGGEPLLPKNRDNLLRLLNFIRNKWKRIDLSIITNAFFLDDKCINELKRFNIRYKISLYGYDNQSFEEYTGFSHKPDSSFPYIEDVQNKVQKLYENSQNITFNIPLHKKMGKGLRTLFSNKKFQKIVVDYGIEIKIIEMVKPRRDSQFFMEDFVDAISVVNKVGAIEEMGEESENFLNTYSYNIDGMHITVYKYPCGNYENCKTCFNNFALTMKPDGKMLICQKALMHNKMSKRIFDDMGVMIEDVNLGKEYGYSDD